MPFLHNATAPDLKRRCREVLKTLSNSCEKCERQRKPGACAHCEALICNDAIDVIEKHEQEIARLKRVAEIQCSNCVWKKNALDINKIPDAEYGACFHGEVWIRCPKCGAGMEIVGREPFLKDAGYSVYQCECGQLFKDR